MSPLDTTLDRRAWVRRAAAAGIALPVVVGGLAGSARAQEHGHEATPGVGSGYVGSDPPNAPVTGTEVAPGQIQSFQRFDPFIQPVEAGPKQIRVTAIDGTLEIAPETVFAGWTFDGRIPGRVLRVRQGDQVDFTFAVDAAAIAGHSLDTHAAETVPDESYRTINPGEEFTWSFVPRFAGAYLYHCGTPPVLYHIAQGMYGAMIVDPPEGWPPAQELCFLQSEFYLMDDPNVPGAKSTHYAAAMGNGMMDYVVINGHASQYTAEPIQVRVGEPIRVFVVNAGPNIWTSFHVVGAIFDATYTNGNPDPSNRRVGQQAISIGPGDGGCVELTLYKPGVYPVVNHAFGHAAHGAIALLEAV